jgi:hypothetical protein
MCLDEPDIRRLLAVGDAAVRSRVFEFLRWAREAIPSACVEEGDESWGAIDLRLDEGPLARVFPKKAGLVKVLNRARLPEDTYGSAARLSKGEWVFELRSSSFDPELFRRCALDNA